MKLVCAWCGTGMERSGYDQTSDGNTSHGLCPECSMALEWQDEGTTLQQHLDSILTPILLVDDQNKVLAANTKAGEMLGKQPDVAGGPRLGPVFDCVYSRYPEGCGREIHCVGCVIRNSISATLRTGQPKVSIPATVSVNSPDQAGAVTFTITTFKTGEFVTLRIDQCKKGDS